MKEYPVLVQPLDEIVEKYISCWNCGSNVVRVLNHWAILTEEGAKELGYSRTSLYDLDIVCAVCGEFVCGYQQIDDCYVVEGLDDFVTEADAKECLVDVLVDEEAERQKGKGMVA